MTDISNEPQQSDSNDDSVGNSKWYSGVTRYQWLVLVIACAGWMFDVYEGQIFNLTRNDMLTELLGGDAVGSKFWGDVFLAIFWLVARLADWCSVRSRIAMADGRS